MGHKASSRSSSAPVLSSTLTPVGERISVLLDRRAVLIAVLLVVLGSARIALTWTVFSHTIDEGAHAACGLEWLERGTYRLETQHPPLARIAIGLGAHLDGAHLNPAPAPSNWLPMTWLGITTIFGGENYERRMACIRSGVLPFFWLASLAVYLWGSLLLGRAGAVLAVFIFTMLPVVLAHSGLATTDLAVTATMALATYALYRLWERPTPLAAGGFGIALGCMLISKFSAIPYFGLSVVLGLVVWARRRRGLAGLEYRSRLIWTSASLGAAFLCLWATYRFSFGATSLLSFPAPFPEWFDGIASVIEHNRHGHPSYFFGSVTVMGSWLFFPVLFLVKTPLGVLALLLFSLFWVPRTRAGAAWLPWTVVAAVFAVAIPAHINIGLRHILPVFPFVALLASFSAMRLLELAGSKRWAGPLLGALLLWVAAGSLLAHPDYLADFNLLAGANPENIAVDSDLDWGQDVLRLGKRLRELGAPSVAFTPSVMVNFPKLGFPRVVPNDVNRPLPGWNAVSVTALKRDRLSGGAAAYNVKLWPELMSPSEVVGRTIWLYYVSPQLVPPAK